MPSNGFANGFARRFGSLNGDRPSGLIDPAGNPLSSRQATYGEFALPPVIAFSSLIGQAWKSFQTGRHDEAMKAGRSEANAMRRDSYLMGLLQERKLATASLPWRVEVDSEADPWQRACKDGLTKILKATPRLKSMLYYMLEAIWYGRYGSQLLWEYQQLDLPLPTHGRTAPTSKQRALVIKNHSPVNGDKIEYQWDGTPHIHVNATEGDSLPGVETIITNIGKAIPLRGTWRTRFAIHRHEVLDADFFDAQSASAINGVGVRSVLYWWNWMRQEGLANIFDFLQRAGCGIRVWRFQAGNDASKREVLEAAQNQSDKVNLLVPWYGDHAPEGVEFVETNPSGAEFMLKLMQHIEQEYIERYVIGQTMSSGADNDSGLGGTGRAEFARDTKGKITAFDADMLAETMTVDVVDVMKRWTYPWADFPVRLKIAADEHDPDKQLEAVSKAWALGVDFREDDVGELTGMPRPQDGDRTLKTIQAENQAQQAAMQPQPGQPGMPGQEGQEGEGEVAGPPGEPQPADPQSEPPGLDDQPLGYSRPPMAAPPDRSQLFDEITRELRGE